DKETVDSYIEKNRAYSVNEDRIAELKKEQEEQRRQFEEDPIGDRPGDKVRITVGTVLGIVFVVIAAVMLVGSFGAQSIFPEFELIRYVPAVGMIATGVSFLIAALLFGMGNRQKSIKRERLDAENAVWDSRKAMRDAQENELSEQIKDLEFEQANLEQDIREFLEQCHMEDWKDRFVSAMYELSNDVDRYWRLSHTYETQEKAHQARALLLEQVDEFADRYRIEISDDIAAELADIQAQAAQYTLAKQSYDRAIWKRNPFESPNDSVQNLAEYLGGVAI
ncbi:MAG: hypothetical protein LIO37_05310, partial [Clostridiales bacterium]|nr:hypothetical protein [Clostridiales bacterium]